MSKPEKFFVPGTSAIEAFEVGERLYLETRMALSEVGYSFFMDIKPRSVERIMGDEKMGSRFDWVNDSETMRAIVPPGMEVAINPNKLRIEISKSKSIAAQMQALKTAEMTLKSQLPEKLRDLIIMSTLSASALAQLDLKFQDEMGSLIFTNWYGLSDSRTGYGAPVSVGRDNPTEKLRIGDWDENKIKIFLVPAVVLPRKFDNYISDLF